MPRPSRAVFLENLNRIMDAKKISNTSMANALGVSKATVGRWREGEAHPRFPDLDAIADFLGVTVAELFNDPEDVRDKEPYEKAFAVIKRALNELDTPPKKPEPVGPPPSGSHNHSSKAAKKPRK